MHLKRAVDAVEARENKLCCGVRLPPFPEMERLNDPYTGPQVTKILLT